jgi:NTE family protein
VLPTVAWGERMLMDGGVANNTPISHAVTLGARRVYVLPTGHACALPRPPRGALEIALHAISLLTHRRLIEDIERHRGDVELVVLPPPCPLSIAPFDFSRADELISGALADARAFLDGGEEQPPPVRMRMPAYPSAVREVRQHVRRPGVEERVLIGSDLLDEELVDAGAGKRL